MIPLLDGTLRAATDGFMPPQSRGLDADGLRRARLALGIVATILACAGIALVWLLANGVYGNALVVGGLGASVASLPFLLRRTGSLRLVGHALAGAVCVGLSALMLQTGARAFPPFALLPGVPMIATLIAGSRAGGLWACIALVQVAGFYAGLRGGLEPRLALSPDFLEQGRFMGAVFMLFFVTLVTLCYERLKSRALDDLAAERGRQIDLRDRFLSHVSHELRTPLAAAQQDVSLVVDGVGGKLLEEQRTYLEGAQRNTQQLVGMIADLVSVSRARTAELDLVPDDVSLDAPLRQAVEHKQEAARARGVAIVLDAGDRLPRVLGDEKALAEVLDKLLENALRFSPEGSRVVLSSRALGSGNVQVRVRDEGPSIDPQRLSGIFEGLEPSPARPTLAWESRTGLGLGLAIARALVEGMGGRIGVDAHPDGGSEFHFTLVGCGRPATRGERGIP